jgi:perosamine synthetase
MMKVMQKPFGSRFGLEEIEAVVRAMQSEQVSGLTREGEGDAFAKEFAEYCGAQHALPVNGACCALSIATVTLGIGPGDEVISNPLTYIATAVYPLKYGATIRFADVNPRTLNVDEDKIEPLITDKTEAIYISSYEGHVPDMDRIMDIAQRYGIYFVFDAARCVGGKFKGRDVGAIPHMTAFSFQEQKNMSTGDGGMLTINHDRADEWMSKARSLRDVWGTGEFISENFRMDEIRAAIGRAQVKKLDAMNDERRAIAHRLTKGLSQFKGIYPVQEFPDRRHVFHWYMARLDSKNLGISHEDFVHVMEEEGIHMPGHNKPIYMTRPYEVRGYQPGLCPIAEELWREQNLRLPLNLGMTDEEIDLIVSAVGRTIDRLTREDKGKGW